MYSIILQTALDIAKNPEYEDYICLLYTSHIARPHTAQDIEIYKRTIDMWFENEQHERLKYDDLPERLKTHRNRTSFVDRFKVVEGDMDHCHTILAHLSKDGHYFIHPDIEQHLSLIHI